MELFGSEDIRCLATGQWEKPQFKCQGLFFVQVLLVEAFAIFKDYV